MGVRLEYNFPSFITDANRHLLYEPKSKEETARDDRSKRRSEIASCFEIIDGLALSRVDGLLVELGENAYTELMASSSRYSLSEGYDRVNREANVLYLGFLDRQKEGTTFYVNPYIRSALRVCFARGYDSSWIEALEEGSEAFGNVMHTIGLVAAVDNDMIPRGAALLYERFSQELSDVLGELAVPEVTSPEIDQLRYQALGRLAGGMRALIIDAPKRTTLGLLMKDMK